MKTETETEKIIPFKAITLTLESLDVNQTINVLNTQRASFSCTIQRLLDKGSKRFTVKRVNDYYFTIKRIM